MSTSFKAVALVVLCAAIGAATSVAPIWGALIPLSVVAIFALARVQRPVLLVFFAFLVLQDPLLFLVGGSESSSGFMIKRLDEALLYPIAFWILVTNRRARHSLALPPLGLLIGACFAGMITSTLIAGAEWAPALTDIVLFSKPFLFLAIGASIRAEAGDIRQGLRVALPCMLFVVLFAVVFLASPSLQAAYLGTLRVVDHRIGMVSAQGFFDGPGPYSWFCAATFAIGYAAYLSFGKSAYLPASVIAAVFAVLSWRRKSMGGIIVMVVVAAAMQFGRDPASRKRAFGIFALAIVLAATILAPVLTALWEYTVHEYGGDPASLARVALHYTSLAIARDHFPFGTGLASFGSYASSVYYSSVYADYGLTTVWGLSPAYPAYITDTFWPMVLGQGGVVTFIPYVLIFALLLRTCWKSARIAVASREDRFLALSALFLLLGSLLESTSSHIYDTSMQSALVMIPAGIAWSRFSLTQGSRESVPVEPTPENGPPRVAEWSLQHRHQRPM